MRLLFLDTETTGLHPDKGDRIVEIAFVEVVDRKLTGNNFHSYINPERDIPEAVTKIHGITNEKVKDEPKFEDIINELDEYLFMDCSNNIDIAAHNAQFDISFLHEEFSRYQKIHIINDAPTIKDLSSVLCTKKMAQSMDKVGPFAKGYKLDDLMKRYNIDIPREQHGALLDATILAHVYLAMTKDWYV